MPESPAVIWREFRARARSASERLAAEMAAAGEDAGFLIDQLQDRLRSMGAASLVPEKLESWERLFGEPERVLFSGPLGSFEKRQPMERTLSAIERHRLEMNDLVRRLPSEMTISGTELAEMLGPDLRRAWPRWWAKRGKIPRPLKLRQVVAAHLGEETARRTRIDRAFEVLLSQAGLHLLAAWQVFRRHQLALLAGGDGDKKALAHEQKWWSRTAIVLSRRIERRRRSYHHWAEGVSSRLAEAVLARSPKFLPAQLEKMAARCQAEYGLWHRQARAVRAVVDLEHELSLVAGEATEGSRQSLDSLHGEHDEVTGELARALAWLRAEVEKEDGHEVFPPPRAGLLSAEQRGRDWCERLSSRVRIHVPVFIETVRPSRGLARLSKPWRELHPRQVLLEALDRVGLGAARDGFREAETEHVAAIRDIEQARQVLRFALEAEQADREGVKNLPREAATNAIALLEHRRESMIDSRPAAEAGLCRAQALTLLQTHTALEIGRLGLFALITRQGARRAAGDLAQAALDSLQVATGAFWRIAAKVFRWASLQLGWEIPAAPRAEPVVERPRLGDVLEVQLGPRELPALYQRLFELAPVEDQRFLVGRDVEMTGLGRAFSLWQAGRGVTVLVVGARGSGKTSLLNCAASAVFGDVPVTRGQFGARIRSAGQMSAFLGKQFGLPEGADLAGELNQGRRVVIIEELERTFLRCINGFEALRELVRLIRATSGSTLWVLSLNQTSFRYLDACLGLGQTFSHRFNAMSVSQEHMTDAILQRHTLSGLRLQFAAAPAGDPRVHGVRRVLGLERSSRELFFDGLYRQSEGLFRSAFQLWLGSIDRVEGGLVRMVQPLDPNYGRLEEELKLEDLFTLQAILQHASLTAQELAEVFDIGEEEGEARLERLLALEILDPEPGGAGLRVRPQAGRFVRDALARQNLA